MNHSQKAYFASLSTNTTRPTDAIIAAADEQLLSGLALGKPAGADIHRRYIGRTEEHHFTDCFSSFYEGHEERMRYHEQRVAGHK